MSEQDDVVKRLNEVYSTKEAALAALAGGEPK